MTIYRHARRLAGSAIRGSLSGSLDVLRRSRVGAFVAVGVRNTFPNLWGAVRQRFGPPPPPEPPPPPPPPLNPPAWHAEELRFAEKIRQARTS